MIKKISTVLIIFLFCPILAGHFAPNVKAGEIEDLKARLKFLEQKNEIISKLDSMQKKMDNIKNDINVFQNNLIEFRVRYDLKSSQGIKTTAPSKVPKSSTGGAVSVKDFNWIMNSMSKVVEIDNGDGQPFKINKNGDGKWQAEHQTNGTASVIVSLGGQKIEIEDFPSNWWMNGTWIFSLKDNDCQLMHEGTERKMEWECG